MGIQKKTVCVSPPQGMDGHWIRRSVQQPDVKEMFGYDEDVLEHAQERHRHGRLILGTLWRVDTGKRVGFAAVAAPCEEHDFWDFSYAIPQARHRDLFSAIHGMDAVLYYMFEVMRVPVVGGTTRLDNPAGMAVVRRLGYAQVGERCWGGPRYAIIQMDRVGWAARRTKLAVHGEPFTVWPAAPFKPPRPNTPE